jgi:hypothetical protein
MSSSHGPAARAAHGRLLARGPTVSGKRPVNLESAEGRK